MSKPVNIHLIVGEDDYLAESTARKLLEAAVPPNLRATAVETIDGFAENEETQLASVKGCLASVQMPPFLDPVKLTWWKGVTFLPGGGRNGKTSEAVRQALDKFVDYLTKHPLPENQVLIITATKLLKTSLFAKAFKTLGDVVEFASGGRSRDRFDAALMRLPDMAAAEKLAFAPGADQAFLSKVGTESRIIAQELAKLRTYLGDERNDVTAADVAEVCSVGGETPEVWDITDAVAQRNAAKLVTAVARFDGDKGFGMMLVTIMEKFFRELIVYRDALDNGWITASGAWNSKLAPEVAADLDAAGVGPSMQKSPWLLRRAVSNARAFTLNELRVARYRMLQVREKFAEDAAIVVQELLRIIKKR